MWLFTFLLILESPVILAFRLLDLLLLLIGIKILSYKANSGSTNEIDEGSGRAWSVLSDWNDRVKKSPNSVFLELVRNQTSETIEQNSDVRQDVNDRTSIIDPNRLTYSEADKLSDHIAFAFYNLLKPSKTSRSSSLLPVLEKYSENPIPVAVLLPSSPFFVTCFLGLVKAGASGVLLNHNLRGNALANALETAFTTTSTKEKSVVEKNQYPNILVVQEGELLERVMNTDDVKSVLERFDVKIVIKKHNYSRGKIENVNSCQGFVVLDDLIIHSQSINSNSSSDLKSKTHHIPKWDSTFFYIFTSGTTGGKAKATIIKHIRYSSGGLLFHLGGRLKENDRIYCALPLYHSSGGIGATCSCILSGATLVIKPKFSARDFAKDILKYKCTVTIYIGEFARYTLKVPITTSGTGNLSERILRKKRDERESFWGQLNEVLSFFSIKVKTSYSSNYTGLRLAFGNGMRPDVWEDFQHRFGISNIVEFYGSTEGNTNMVNNCGKVGAVGVVPFFVQKLYPIRLVKCDALTGEILRDPVTNLAILAKPNEPGQLLGLISRDAKSPSHKGKEKSNAKNSLSIETDPSRMFDGYTDTSATSKKVVRGIMNDNDLWFASGDLLKRDWFGFYYWVDRIGDTFRWKGENVSTCEVAAAFFSSPPTTSNSSVASTHLSSPSSSSSCSISSSSSSSSHGYSLVDVNVYGVEVPNYPGRVGMARITLAEEDDASSMMSLEDDFDFESLYQKLQAQLPSYAVPLFLRFAIANSMGNTLSKNENNSENNHQHVHDKHTTLTFKQIKGLLREEGFMPDKVSNGEPVFIRNDKKKTFSLFDKGLRENLLSGRLRI